jgi:DNA methyltransferase 1-associated protein 1
MSGGASAADVRSILQYAGAGPSSTTQPTASSSKQALSTTSSFRNVSTMAGTATTTRKTKPEGIPRELYALIGTGLPTMNAQMAAKPKLKQKPKLSDGRVGRW